MIDRKELRERQAFQFIDLVIEAVARANTIPPMIPMEPAKAVIKVLEFFRSKVIEKSLRACLKAMEVF